MLVWHVCILIGVLGLILAEGLVRVLDVDVLSDVFVELVKLEDVWSHCWTILFFIFIIIIIDCVIVVVKVVGCVGWLLKAAKIVVVVKLWNILKAWLIWME